jgi:hypothetical protein
MNNFVRLTELHVYPLNWALNLLADFVPAQPARESRRVGDDGRPPHAAHRRGAFTRVPRR